ncbi:membrane protein [Chitinophaga cymbidii]|uniref:Membrane protein n=2 Tax=Chitinophaga cymbidii TaxID=1096750 RepID=A0A512RJ55_9BACT|nr:membrane protein [Chitinophaga cymbidii]
MLASFVVVLSSCSKDWLDEKPDISTVIPETLQDIQGLLDNASGIMNTNSPALAEIASDDFYVLESSYAGLAQNERNAYIRDKIDSYTQVSDWFGVGNKNGSYARVFYCNLALETLGKIKFDTPSDKETWDNLKGQALFQRSRTFYELAQVFANPYNPNTAKNELGIPLRVESDINIKSVRASVQQTYDQIINNLLEAKSLLPINALYKTRASKVSVYALLARIYLNMEQYENALKNADSCLALYNTLLNYNDLSSSASFPIQIMNNEVIFHSTMINYVSLALRVLIDDELYSLYDEHDKRKSVFFGSNANGRTFKGNYSGSRLLFNGLSTNEQYLIRAECYARAGKVPEAMADLNTLYRNRWDSNEAYIDLTALDADDALRQVLLERRKELLLRGLRWSDLRRLNRDPRFAITLTRTIAGETYTLEPNSYKYTFPIPDDIIEITGMPQNPGWER